MTWFVIIALCIVFSFYKRAIKAGGNASVSSETNNDARPQRESIRQHQQENSSPYFSYENDDFIATSENVDYSGPCNIASDDNAPNFDLRQAIIYDTILNNPYTADK